MRRGRGRGMAPSPPCITITRPSATRRASLFRFVIKIKTLGAAKSMDYVTGGGGEKRRRRGTKRKGQRKEPARSRDAASQPERSDKESPAHAHQRIGVRQTRVVNLRPHEAIADRLAICKSSLVLLLVRPRRQHQHGAAAKDPREPLTRHVVSRM